MTQTLLQTLLDALAVGSLYALIALGYSLVYGILKFINFAHSDVFVAGAWISLAASTAAGWGGKEGGIEGWLWWAALGVTIAAALALLAARALPAWLGRGVGPRAADALAVGLAASGALGLVTLAGLARSSGAPVLSGGLILVAAMTACAGLNLAIERLAYRPLRHAPRLNVLITAIGVSLLMQNTGQLDSVFGARPRPFPALLPDRVLNETTVAEVAAMRREDGSVELASPVTLEENRRYRLRSSAGESIVTSPPGVASTLTLSPPLARAEGTLALVREPLVPLRLLDVVGAATALGLMLALDVLVFRTKTGRALRAVSFSPSVASLMGINVDRVIGLAFVLAGALAAAAGFLVGVKYGNLTQPAASTWVLLGLKAFVAAVVGGIGNLRGAMLGGLLIGLIEFFGVAYVSANLRDVYVFGVLILVLLLRPGGIMGSASIEKV